MQTYKGNLGSINKTRLPVLMDQVENHGVLYDVILMGKPWCGNDGLYVQSRSVRPDGFVNFSVDNILGMLGLNSDDGVKSDHQP